MTNKKYITRRARVLRSVVKGLSLPQSVKIVKTYLKDQDVISTFQKLGFDVDVKAQWVDCDCCSGHYRGAVVLTKNGRRSVLQYDDRVILP